MDDNNKIKQPAALKLRDHLIMHGKLACTSVTRAGPRATPARNDMHRVSGGLREWRHRTIISIVLGLQ